MNRVPASKWQAAAVSVKAVPLWRLRLRQSLPRMLLHATVAAGLLASIRFAVAPPRPDERGRQPARVRSADLQAEGFATLFARAYLSWRQGDPEARRLALEQFAGPGLALEAGTEPPLRGSQRVVSEQVVQEREPRPHLHVYSIAAQTVPEGLVYLAVPVLHAPGGSVSLAGHPAFVGAPAAAPATPALEAGAEVQDAGLRTVVVRALRNYLAPAPSELAADLTPGASVSPPSQGLALESVQGLTWAAGRRDAVVAQVEVAGDAGARYTLAYEVEVRDVAGRWEVAAIQMEAGA